MFQQTGCRLKTSQAQPQNACSISSAVFCGSKQSQAFLDEVKKQRSHRSVEYQGYFLNHHVSEVPRVLDYRRFSTGCVSISLSQVAQRFCWSKTGFYIDFSAQGFSYHMGSENSYSTSTCGTNQWLNFLTRNFFFLIHLELGADTSFPLNPWANQESFSSLASLRGQLFLELWLHE